MCSFFYALRPLLKLCNDFIVDRIFVTVFVFAALLQLEGGGTLLASVQALGCSCAIEKQPIPRSVSWMRRAPCAQVITHTHTNILFSHCGIQYELEYILVKFLETPCCNCLVLNKWDHGFE